MNFKTQAMVYTGSMAMKQEGRFFEDFTVGDVYPHSLGRTITDSDNIWFSLLTCNTNEIHFNEDYTKKNFAGPPFNGRMVVNGYLVLSIVVGLSVADTSKNGFLLSQKNMNVLAPTFAGDTIYSESTVLAKRESKSHATMGIVDIKTKGYNQKGVTVIELERTIMIRKRGQAWATEKTHE